MMRNIEMLANRGAGVWSHVVVLPRGAHGNYYRYFSAQGMIVCRLANGSTEQARHTHRGGEVLPARMPPAECCRR